MWDFNEYGSLLEEDDIDNEQENGEATDVKDPEDSKNNKAQNENASYVAEFTAQLEADITNDNGVIDSDHYDDEVDPSTVNTIGDEADNYDSDPSIDTEVTDYMSKDNDGTTEVESESFTGWDDLF
jgi:hypothetical protein